MSSRDIALPFEEECFNCEGYGEAILQGYSEAGIREFCVNKGYYRKAVNSGSTTNVTCEICRGAGVRKIPELKYVGDL